MKTHRNAAPIILLSALVLTATPSRSVAQTPMVETLPASEMHSDEATFNGTVNPNGTATMAWFEWGTSTGYGNSTATVDAGNGTNAMPMDTTVTGLVQNLAYHYRIAASNSFGTVYGDDETFGIWQLDNITLADSGAGSLREVITGAPAGSTIVMTNSGTLVLTSGELAINRDLSITGPGAAQLAISGNNSSRVINIAEGCTVVISGLTIRNGRSANGANGSYGAPGGQGGAGSPGGGIYNDGNLTLNECAVVNNHAGSGGYGGPSASAGESPGYSGGLGGAGGIGGGIYNTGSLTLNRCTLNQNQCGAGGGGGAGGRGDNGGSGGKGGNGGSGGGIHNTNIGSLTLNRCTLNENFGGIGGVGGYGGPGNDYDTFIGSDDGGPGGNGGYGGNGGGIYNAGILAIDHCTFSGNQTGAGNAGGRGGSGYVGSLDDGAGGKGGNGGTGGHGGGVWNVGTISAQSCTLAYNATSLGGAAGEPGSGEGNGGPGTIGVVGNGGGINNSATFTCVNTIAASNTNPSDPDDVGGTFISLGYNLIGNTNGASGFVPASNDLFHVEALLEALAYNGGPTLTHLPQQESPAINAGLISTNMPATDQRGFPRIFDGRADIGAVELQPWGPTVTTLPATNAAPSGIRFLGEVNPNGTATMAWFEWGTNTGYGNSTTGVDAGNGTNAVPMDAVVIGLVQNLNYHYRIAASNSLGIVYGDDETFGIWQLDDLNLSDSGAGSLREVIAGAPAGSTIVMTNSGTLVLTSGELAINKDLTITGLGADQLAISGNNSSRVFNIAEGCTVEISGITIRNGHSDNGAQGSYGSPGGPGGPGSHGGGIYNAGNLTLTECAIVNNHAGSGGNGGQGAIGDPGKPGGTGGLGGSGGGIYNNNSVVLNRCTLSGNSSGYGGYGGNAGNGTSGDDGGPGGTGGGGGSGGAIYNAGMLTIDHCTVSGNKGEKGGKGGNGGNGGVAFINGDGGNGGHCGTGGSGGGIWNAGTLSVTSGSIAYNTAYPGGNGGLGGDGGAWGDGDNGSPGAGGSVGGISNSATAGCFNTIVASNSDPSGPDDVGGTFTSTGYNLIGTTNGASGFVLASNDLLNVEAHLKALADNGGPTPTHLPQLASPAIHAGSTNNLPATDQRGFPRIFNGRADIGAVELQEWWAIVATLPASNAVPAGVYLHGEVNPKGSHTFTWFEYGLTLNYGASTETINMTGDPDAIHEIYSAPPDLLPWMTYHYRAVASNSIGRVAGSDLTVTMPAPVTDTPALSVLSDLVLAQGGSTQVWFTAEPAGVDVRVACNNPVLLPEDALEVGGSATLHSLDIAPDPSHSGPAQITVTASDGMQSDRQTFTLVVEPIDPSQLLNLESQTASNGIWRLQVHDDGTASTNYAMEFRPDLSPTSTWSTATNVVDLGGGEYEIDLALAQGDIGFYRIRGFRMLQGGFDSGELATEEGAVASGVVVVFNSSFSGTLGYTWTDETGTSHVGTVDVNGTTAVIPLPAAILDDDTGIGRLKHLTLALDAGAGYVRSGNIESQITIEENDADWLATIETDCGMLGFTLTILQDNGTFNGQLQSEGFGFFPTNILVQLTFAQDTFTAVATNIPLPVFAGDPAGFTNHMDLRLDAANAPGETTVGPDLIEGEATLVVKVPGRPYLDVVQTGPFILARPPTAASTNEVSLQPIP